MRITIFDKNDNKIGSLNKCEISKQREHELKRIGAAYASEPVFADYCDNQVVIDSKKCYEDLENAKEKNMTYNDKIKKSIEKANLNVDDLNKLVAMAYYIGREEASKEILDKYYHIRQEQIKRAKEMRYKYMAYKIVGIFQIYSQDYSQDILKTFGRDHFDKESVKL